ncbi:MAG: hypothetical protein GX589_05265, partial [Deltaproteobacteria bacterium]|nr:hypothetical protein [Deltaproteobacteria bacterium]
MSAIVEILYEGAKNCRLDVFLVNALAAEPEYAELARSQVKLRIERGSVSVDGCTVTKAGHTLKPGSLVRVELPEPEPSHLKPFNFPLTILYEDEALLVID